MSNVSNLFKLHHNLLLLDNDNACRILCSMVNNYNKSKLIFEGIFKLLYNNGDGQFNKELQDFVLNIVSESQQLLKKNKQQNKKENNNKINYFETMPDDVMLHLTSYFDVSTLYSIFSGLCLRFFVLSRSNNGIEHMALTPNMIDGLENNPPQFQSRFNLIKKLKYFSIIDYFGIISWNVWANKVELLHLNYGMCVVYIFFLLCS